MMGYWIDQLTKGTQRGVWEAEEIDVEVDTSAISVGSTSDIATNARRQAIRQCCGIRNTDGIALNDSSIPQLPSSGVNDGKASQGSGEDGCIHVL